MTRKLSFLFMVLMITTIASCVEIPVSTISRIDIRNLSIPEAINENADGISIAGGEVHIFYTGNDSDEADEVVDIDNADIQLSGNAVYTINGQTRLRTDQAGTYTFNVSYGGVSVTITYKVYPDMVLVVGPNDAFQSIQDAIDFADPGFTIQVEPGIYVESNILVDKTLTIEGTGASREDVMIVPAAEDGNVDSAFGSNAQNGFIIQAHSVTLRNMTLDGQGNPVLTSGKNNFRIGVVTNDVAGVWNNLTVDNLLIKNLYRRGISIWPTSIQGTLIENSRIENVIYNQGIQAAGHSTVLNNEIDGAFQGIVAFAMADTPAGTITVSGNTLSNITMTANSFQGQPRAIQVGMGNHIRHYIVTGNVISDVDVRDPDVNGTVGIYTVRPSSDSVVSDNTISLISKNAVGILAGWGYEQGYTVSGNAITVGSNAIGVLVHANGVSGSPLFLQNNTLSTHAGVTPETSESFGVYVSNEYLYYSADRGNTNSELTSNSFNGFYAAIYTYRTNNLTHMVNLFHSGSTFTNNTFETLSEAADGVTPFDIINSD